MTVAPPYPGLTTGPSPGVNSAATTAQLDPETNGDVSPVERSMRAEPQPPKAAGLRELLDLAGWVFAPASLVTGALYWAGWNRTKAYWRTFGIDQALLQFSTTDYMVRAVDTVFPLLVVVAAGTLVARRFHLFVKRRLCTSSRMWCLQTLKCVLLVVGVASVSITAAGLFPAVFFWIDPVHVAEQSSLLPPILGLAGTASLGYATYLNGNHQISGDGSIRLPSPSRIGLAMLTLLMVLWMYWTAEVWGRLQGAEEADSADRYPTVVYSVEPLQLSGRGIEPLDVDQSNGGYRYGYSGLWLLRYSKEHYFLLTPDEDRVVILKESEQLRFEFKPPPEHPDTVGSPTQTRASVYVNAH